jgi:hypothetical protein
LRRESKNPDEKCGQDQNKGETSAESSMVRHK